MLVMHIIGMIIIQPSMDPRESCDASEERQLVLSRCCTITGVMSGYEVGLGSDGDQVRVWAH